MLAQSLPPISSASLRFSSTDVRISVAVGLVAVVDHVVADYTNSDNRGTCLSGFVKITGSVKAAYLPSTSFQNSATVFWLMVSKVLIERRMSTSRSGLKVSSITFNGIPARNV